MVKDVEEKEEAIDNQVDFALMRVCKREIKEHCDEEDPQNIIKCLTDVTLN